LLGGACQGQLERLGAARQGPWREACRYHARDATRTLETLGLTQHERNGHHTTMLGPGRGEGLHNRLFAVIGHMCVWPGLVIK
jgi:hypothetical protein